MIDVVLPTRNAPAVLALTLTHLRAYGLDAGLVHHAYVLDNASTDPDTPALLAAVARWPGVTVFRHERDVGVWASVNRGLALTTQRHVLVLTADVLLGPACIPVLREAMRQSGAAYVAPHPAMPHLDGAAALLTTGTQFGVVANDYNGALWLLDWHRCREHVGWYDPQFYVCYGDTDYIERLRAKAEETQDGTWLPHVVRGLTVCHLDKQTRRADFTAAGDSRVEREDGTRFQAKWAGTVVAARHPAPQSEAEQVALRDGWDAGKVG